MMPWDTATPVWQQAALLELAAELVASLWHRWPNLRTVPLKGHRDWMSTECPGSYYPRLGSIYSRAQQLYGMYAGSFGQFNKTGGKPVPQSSQPQPQPATRRLIMPNQTIRDYQGKPVTVEQILARIDAHVRPITRGNRSSELRQEVADTKNIVTATQAQVTALTAAIGALSKAQGVDPKLVERAIREAIAEALDGLELTGEIKIGTE